MLLSSSDTRLTLMHLFLFTITAQREPWFQYVRREYATAINFPYIITLGATITSIVYLISGVYKGIYPKKGERATFLAFQCGRQNFAPVAELPLGTIVFTYSGLSLQSPRPTRIRLCLNYSV